MRAATWTVVALLLLTSVAAANVAATTELIAVDAVGPKRGWDPKLIKKKVNSSYTQGVQRCYQRAVNEDITLKGQLDVVFVLDHTGRVVKVDVTGVKESVAGCVKGLVVNWVFAPPAKKAAATTFKASFRMAPPS